MKMRVLVIASMGVLSACGGGEPSDADIADALKKNLAQQIQNSNGVFGETSMVLNSSKKMGCSKGEGDSGYTCDVEIDMTVPELFGGNQKAIRPVRFINTDDGWSAVLDAN